MSQDDIVIKALPAQALYGFRDVLPHIRQGPVCRMELTRLVSRHISQKKLGHFMAVLHKEAFTMKNVDVEMGFLLKKEVNKSLQLSSGQALTTRTPAPGTDRASPAGSRGRGARAT